MPTTAVGLILLIEQVFLGEFYLIPKKVITTKQTKNLMLIFGSSNGLRVVGYIDSDLWLLR